VTWLDIVVLIIVGYSVLAGFSGGFARVGIGFVATLLGVFFGFWFYGVAGERVADYVSSRGVANLIGFLIVFGVFVLAGAIVGRVLANMFKWVGLSWLDRLLGAGFGFIRGALVAVAFVTVALAFAPAPPPPSIVQSRTLPYIMGTSSVLAAMTPHGIKDSFRETRQKVKKIWDGHVRQSDLRRREG
jgi:membrane protein required for colicin V production